MGICAMKLKKGVAILLIACLLKSVWVMAYYVPGAKLLNGGARPDLISRRAFLLDRVVGAFQNPEQHHGSLPDLFQGEWALGSFSMTAVGLTNMAFLYPETRSEALSAVGVLIERMRAPAVSRFDTIQWHEEALGTLDKKRGHIAYLGHLNLALAAWHYLGGDKRYRDYSVA